MTKRTIKLPVTTDSEGNEYTYAPWGGSISLKCEICEWVQRLTDVTNGYYVLDANNHAPDCPAFREEEDD